MPRRSKESKLFAAAIFILLFAILGVTFYGEMGVTGALNLDAYPRFTDGSDAIVDLSVDDDIHLGKVFDLYYG